jgi:hypothetical protein
MAQLVDDNIAVTEQFDIKDHVAEGFAIDKNLRNMIW